MKIIDSLNIDDYQNRIDEKINKLKTFRFRQQTNPDFAFKGRVVEGIDGEKLQDHYVPLYWFGRAVICEHQCWIDNEFKKTLGIAIGPFFEWASNDSPDEDEYGSTEFTPIKILNNNQLKCSSSIVEAILQSNIIISVFSLNQ